jgi:heat-inducible transcriptional repressor
VPTDAGRRFYVDRLPVPARERGLELQLVRREVDEAMRVTSETLSQVTNLLAIVSAPPIETATIRHVEVLLLQPQVLMVVVITSTGGVSKKVLTFEGPIDQGLAAWAGAYLNERLQGVSLGARMLHARMSDPSLGPTELAFLERLLPAFTQLAATAEHTLYVEGAGRLLSEHRFQDLTQINELMDMLERRVALLGVLSAALGRGDVLVRIGHENELPALHSLALVAAGYGLPTRDLGTVSVIGPVRMDYPAAIRTVREAARQLSRYIEDVYE